jgi:hypothetical protein
MNPEFKRNVWLEISPGRLILMPVVLGLVAALVSVLGAGNLLEALFTTACVLSAVLVAGWGSFAVISSINSEFAERTWDQQRLSALTPWEMAWGKLIGSAAYAWYGGLLCAGAAFLLALMLPNSSLRCLWLFTGLIASVALHAWLMASRLHTLDTQVEKSSTMAGRLFAVLVVLQVLPMVFVLSNELVGGKLARGSWWGLDLPLAVQNFVVASLLLLLGLLALWRSMAKQLMLRTTPWAWGLGIVAFGWIATGFGSIQPTTALPLFTAVVALAATYFALFTEKNNLLVWRAAVFHWRNSSLRRFLQALPLWPVSWALALLLATFYSLLVLGSDGSVKMSVVTSILWMSVLHCLRDCGIYLFFAFRSTKRKPLGMTLLTLFILGVVLPTMFSFGSLDAAQWFEPLYSIKNLFENPQALGWTPWVVMFFHLTVVGALVAWQWSRSPRAD